jgi:hypothetical protein
MSPPLELEPAYVPKNKSQTSGCFTLPDAGGFLIFKILCPGFSTAGSCLDHLHSGGGKRKWVVVFVRVPNNTTTSSRRHNNVPLIGCLRHQTLDDGFWSPPSLESCMRW